MFLAIDYGTKRIGLALGEMLPYGAGMLEISLGREVIFDKILKICQENEVEKIIIGIPKLASGDDGFLGIKIREFGQRLSEHTDLPVEYEEETLTSSEAERIFEDSGVKFDKESGKIDEMAAILILEQYLNNQK